MSSSSGKFPLTIASENNDADEVLNLLIEAEFTLGEGGAAQLVNARDPKNFGMTALHEASYSNQVEIVRLLFRNYSNEANRQIDANVIQNVVPVTQEQGDVADDGSVGGGGGENVDPDVQDDHGWTPLMCTVINNYLEIFKVILEHGANVDLQNNDGSTALTLAAEKNHGEAIEMVQLLIDHGAQLDQVDSKQGHSALMFAALNNHREIFELLLQNGPALDTQDKSGRTALYFLCDNSWTALMVAATDNRQELVLKLCEAGANVNLADKDGETPIQVAVKWGHPEVVEILLKFGATAPEGAIEEARERQCQQRSTTEGKAAKAAEEAHKSALAALNDGSDANEKLEALLMSALTTQSQPRTDYDDDE